MSVALSEALADAIAVVQEIIANTDESALRSKPSPGEWSAHDVVCHLVLNEINTASSIRRMLTEDSPVVGEIDDGLVGRFSPVYPSTRSAFEVWRALRVDTVRLAAAVSVEELGRVGAAMHFGQRVERTVREYLEGRVRHDQDHIGQMRSALR